MILIIFKITILSIRDENFILIVYKETKSFYELLEISLLLEYHCNIIIVTERLWKIENTHIISLILLKMFFSREIKKLLKNSNSIIWNNLIKKYKWVFYLQHNDENN